MLGSLGPVRAGELAQVVPGRHAGEYSQGGGQAFQEYTNSVRVFTFQAARQGSGIQLNVQYQGSVPEVTSGMDPNNPYHRRDLTVKPALDPTGAPRLGVYGGVFKGGRTEGYLEPIYITAGSTLGISVGVDISAKQALSQYDVPILQVYSQSRGASYSTFFGGISQYYWDETCSCLKVDPIDVAGQGLDSLPFIHSVSTMRVTSAATDNFLHRDLSFPPAGGLPSCATTTGGSVSAQFLGAESKLIPVPLPAVTKNGVLLLDQIHKKTVIGYLVGGIAAYCPPGGSNASRCYVSTQGSSCASNQIYQVTLDPTAATPTAPLTLPAPAVTVASPSR